MSDRVISFVIANASSLIYVIKNRYVTFSSSVAKYTNKNILSSSRTDAVQMLFSKSVRIAVNFSSISLPNLLYTRMMANGDNFLPIRLAK